MWWRTFLHTYEPHHQDSHGSAVLATTCPCIALAGISMTTRELPDILRPCGPANPASGPALYYSVTPSRVGSETKLST